MGRSAIIAKKLPRPRLIPNPDNLLRKLMAAIHTLAQLSEREKFVVGGQTMASLVMGPLREAAGPCPQRELKKSLSG